MRRTISLFICVFVATFFMIGCSNNDQAVGPAEVTSPQAKYDVATSTNQTQLTLQTTHPRFPRSGYFEVKTEAERKEAEKLFPDSISGQNPKPPGEKSFKPNVESGGVQPMKPSEPEWGAKTRITTPNPDDLYHYSKSWSTVQIDYIDVFHTFYRNGQLVGYGFDYCYNCYEAYVGSLETGIGNPGYLWEAVGDHLFEDDELWPYYWNPTTYDSTVK